MSILDNNIVDQTNSDIEKIQILFETIFQALIKFYHENIIFRGNLYYLVVRFPDGTVSSILFSYSYDDTREKVFKNLMSTFTKVTERYGCKISDLNFLQVTQ